MTRFIFFILSFACSTQNNQQSQSTTSTNKEASKVERPSRDIVFTPFHVHQVPRDEGVFLPIKKEHKEKAQKIELQQQYKTLQDFSNNRKWKLASWYGNKEVPKLAPIGIPTSEQSASKSYTPKQLEKYILHPAFKKTGKQTLSSGLFHEADVMLLAMAFAKNDAQQPNENLVVKQLKAEYPQNSLASYGNKFPEHPEFRGAPSSTVPISKILDKSKLSIFCWGDFDRQQWPTPSDYGGGSKDWKDKNPRIDLAGNTCEFWLLGNEKPTTKEQEGEYDHSDYKAELTSQTTYYLVASLSDKKGLSPEVQSEGFPSDFRTTNAKTGFSVSSESLFFIAAGASQTSSKSEETNTESLIEEAKDSTKDCDCAEVFDESLGSCHELPASQQDNYLDVIKRAEDWITQSKKGKQGFPLTYNATTNTFSVTDLTSNIQDCVALNAFFIAFTETMGCKPVVEKTDSCTDGIKSLVHFTSN